MKINRFRLFFLASWLCISFSLSLWANKTPVEINYAVMNMQALRYYPFTEEADSIVLSLSDNAECYRTDSSVYRKTTVNAIGNRELLENQLNRFAVSSPIIFRTLIGPYLPWLQYATFLKENDNRNLVLTIGLHEESDNDTSELKNEGIYGFLGKKNVKTLLDNLQEEVDLFKKTNEAKLSRVKSPLYRKEMNHFRYYKSSTEILDGEEVLEIAFYPKKKDLLSYVGYLYVTTSLPHRLVKTKFTLNNPDGISSANRLFTQYFKPKDDASDLQREEYAWNFGDDLKGSIQVNRLIDYTNEKDSLSPAEKQAGNLETLSYQTKAYRNFKAVSRLLLTDYFSLGGERGLFELGEVSEMFSHNEQEGFRFKAGANTTLQLNKHWLLGGYWAYGTKDKQWKHRSDILYSFLPKERDIWEFPKRLLRMTYVSDLNIPGEDILTGNRDFILYSFSHKATRDMSLQKSLVIDYEHEWNKFFSFKVGGRYLNDKPVGRLQYLSEKRGEIKEITFSELDFSFRYAPREAFFQVREKRKYLRKGSFELNLNHRVGLKDVLGSDYRYHITYLNAYKEFLLPANSGRLELEVSGQKVWNALPFPFLFIKGNQSYIFNSSDYNLMNFSEFISDDYISGKVNLQFKWSPFRFFSEKSKVKTNLGLKALYGPLSDKNNPDFNPELFTLNDAITPLGNKPYMEMNIGFSNLLKFFRLEWVQRLSYLEAGKDGQKKRKGSLFVTVDFSF
ncbi:MAG: hypothetical protein LBH12_04595 [Dysgonamonadaceae bacterium]|jgi:hypothetical protein|nr:hypothetical protein [Dysgonamonadaceae bacterium]